MDDLDHDHLYVIMLIESYDAAEVNVPHAFCSYKTKNELREEIGAFYERWRQTEGRVYVKQWGFHNAVLNLGESGLRLVWDDITMSNNLAIPGIYTIREWFDSTHGKRINRGEWR